MNRTLLVSIILMLIALGLFFAYSVPTRAQGPDSSHPAARIELERLRKQPAQFVPGTVSALGEGGGVNTQGVQVDTASAPTQAPNRIASVPPPPRGLDMEEATYDAAKRAPPRSNAPQNILTAKDAPASLNSPHAPAAPAAPFAGAVSYEGPYYTGWAPPDPNIAPSMSDLLVAYNESFTIYDKANPGNLLYSSTFLAWYIAGGFSFPSSTSQFDPKVIYDYNNDRVIMVNLAVTRTGTFSESWLMVSVSRQNSAAGLWWEYKLNLKFDGSTPTEFWGDYPGVASDGTNLYVAVNMFDHPTGTFQYSKIRVLKLAELYAGSLTSGWWDFYGFVGGDLVTKAFTAMPAHHYFSGPPTYFLARRHNVTGTGGSKLSLFRVDLPPSNNWPTNNPTLTLQTTVDTTYIYTVPVGARQPLTTTTIDTGDDRILSGRQFASDLWFSQTCLDEFNITSALCLYGIGTDGTKFFEEHAFDDGVSDYYYPAVATDQSENIGIVFSRSSTGEYASIRRDGMKCCTFSSLENSALVKAGEDMYVRISTGSVRNRWGDFSGIERDPNGGNTFWLYDEFTKPKVSGTQGGGRWGTWVANAFYPVTQLFLPLIKK